MPMRRRNILFCLPMHRMSDKLGMPYPAETGFQIETDPDHVRAPSAAFVGPERMKLVENDDPRYDRYFPGPPDLAVEVVIPSDTYFYIEEKLRIGLMRAHAWSSWLTRHSHGESV